MVEFVRQDSNVENVESSTSTGIGKIYINEVVQQDLGAVSGLLVAFVDVKCRIGPIQWRGTRFEATRSNDLRSNERRLPGRQDTDRRLPQFRVNSSLGLSVLTSSTSPTSDPETTVMTSGRQIPVRRCKNYGAASALAGWNADYLTERLLRQMCN